MFKGETVDITYHDGSTETLDDVLIDPQEQVDIPTSTGAEERVAYILHFPKGYTGDLYRARIEVRGERFRVLGHPKPYTAENNLLDWNMPVKVARLNYTHELEVQRAYATQNEYGDSITQWQTLLTAFCRVADTEQSESVQAGRVQSSRTVQITLDWADELKTCYNTNARAILDGDTYDITAVKNINWEDDVCVLTAVRHGDE